MRVELLARSDMVAVVSATDLELLATMFAREDFAEGAEICRAGDPAVRMVVIAAGEAEVDIGDRAKGRIVLRPGEVLGVHGMFVAGTRTARVFARGTVRALALDHQRFRRATKQTCALSSSASMPPVTTSIVVRTVPRDGLIRRMLP